jgi:tetratricopeptide (TPR) repeat protein
LLVGVDQQRFAVSGDLDESLKVYETWTQTYPRDFVPWNNLGVMHSELGDYGRALAGYQEAERLNADNALAAGNRAFALYSLSRIDEAKSAAEAVMKRFPNNALAFAARMHVACVQDDRATFDEMLRIGREREMFEVIIAALSCPVRHGRFVEARDRFRELQSMLGEAARERRGRPMIEMAMMEWRLGRPERAKEFAAQADSLLPVGSRAFRLPYLLAELGDHPRARALLSQYKAAYPQATSVLLWSTLAEATFLLEDGKPDAALERVESVRRFEGRWPDVRLLRARALHKAGRLTDSAADYQWLADHVCPPPSTSPCSLAPLSLARVRAAAGDAAGARQAYDRFLDLWRNADADLPLLVEARRERAALNGK